MVTATQMDRPAELVIWHEDRSVPSEARIYPSLQAALEAASDRAVHPDTLPWIVTEEGDILSPRWIDDYLARRAAPGRRPPCWRSFWF